MDLVTGAMGSLIPKLLKMLGDEYKLQTGMKKKVQFLVRELESVHAFLRKVSDVPWDQLDDQVKLWACEAREASFDMEDVLDTFLVRVEGSKPSDDLSRIQHTMKKMTGLFSKGKARHDIGVAIKDIKIRLQEVADRRTRYRIEDIMVNPATTTSTNDPRLQAMYKEVSSFVGINKPRDDLISMLSDDVAGRKKILAIVGIGGLGKTTLAKAVYDKIRVDFKCGALVPIGRNPNLSKVLMDILYELDKNRFADIHTKNRDERQLIDNLREFLIDKRYFIVIDDLWDTKYWVETLGLALLENNRGSRIIITTRNSEVAKIIGDQIYKMPPLSYDNSKRLFYKRIFGDEERWPYNEPTDIPTKILKKCDGIPLAIITMAGLLVGKPRARWSDLFTSIGFGHKDDKQVDITMKILAFSYYDMPAYLRSCLLYLAVFPEDYLIRKESLIWRWIAEDFIHGKPEIRLFELGEQYFNDLVNRNMVQSIESKFYGTVQFCRVHDMVLDLIHSISLEENFFAILRNVEGTVSSPPKTARRLALHKITIDHTTHAKTVVAIPQVRSMVAIRCAFGNRVPLSSYKLLRVLDLEACTNMRPCHLVHLGYLVHLRFLGLQNCTQIDDLPNKIGNLKFLQTLNIESTGIRQLTPSVSRLTQLVCLKCDRFRTLAPNWIGKLTSLEMLQVVIDFSNGREEDHARCFLKELGSLTELRVFRCRVFEMDESMQRDLVLSLHKLHKIQNLELWHGSLIAADTTLWGEGDFVFPQHLQILYLDLFKFLYLPSCIGSAYLPNLTHLSLWVDHMDQKDLEYLGSLPELYYLRLCIKSTVTISSTSAHNGYFQKLRFCHMPLSMVHLQCKVEDSSASLHVWNGIDIVPFGCSENICSLAPHAVMSNLEVLESKIFVQALKDSKVECSDIIGLGYFPSLQRVQVQIKCEGASAAEVDEAAAALRRSTDVHPNQPTLELERWNEDQMISAVQDPKLDEDDASMEKGDQKQKEGQPMAVEDVTKQAS